jgi:methanogenic corrinoid protein MtbC1
MGRALKDAIPAIDRSCIEALEKHFVDQELYRREDVAQRHARLAEVVADAVVPQLLHLHNVVLPQAPKIEHLAEVLVPTASDISDLAHLILGADLEVAVAYVLTLRDKGLSMDTLFLELLEPAARRLGELWDSDECDFIDVTLGVARLQKLLASFNNSHKSPTLATRRTVLLATTPGDQHYFGASMVERFLGSAGWSVQSEFDRTAEQIGDAAAREWFAVAALTVGSDKYLPALKNLIALIRQQSRNPVIGIMVGGPAFAANPGLARIVGADATAINAPAAVLMAQKLFDLGTGQPGQPDVRTMQ